MNTETATQTLADLIDEPVQIIKLNDHHKAEASERAQSAARYSCRRLQKGGSDYAALKAEIGTRTPDEQAMIAAGRERWNIYEEAMRQFPDVAKPDQGEQAEEEYKASIAAWEGAQSEVEQKRADWQQERLDAEVARAKKMSARERQEICEGVLFAQEFAREYATRLRFELLFRAVRSEDDRSERYFTGPEQAEDAPDAVQNALWTAYEALEV